MSIIDGAVAASKEAGPAPARGKPRIIALYLNDNATGITVESDSKWPGMFRIRRDGTLSDMVNLSRAKDAALTWARPRGLGGKEVARWKVRETRGKAPHSDYSGPGAPSYLCRRQKHAGGGA